MVFQLSDVHSLSSSGTRNNEFVGYWLGGSGRLDPAKATLNLAAKPKDEMRDWVAFGPKVNAY